MGLFDRLTKPYEKTYNRDDLNCFVNNFLTLFHLIESTQSDILTDTPKRLYATYYSMLYSLLKDRPYANGEIGLHVMQAICGGSFNAYREKRKMTDSDILLGPALLYGYCTQLLMQTQFVSPGKAMQLRIFDGCFSYVSVQKHDDLVQAIDEWERNASKTKAPNDLSSTYHSYLDIASSIGMAHFRNERWAQVEPIVNQMITGESVWPTPYKGQ